MTGTYLYNKYLIKIKMQQVFCFYLVTLHMAAICLTSILCDSSAITSLQRMKCPWDLHHLCLYYSRSLQSFPTVHTSALASTWCSVQFQPSQDVSGVTPVETSALIF